MQYGDKAADKDVDINLKPLWWSATTIGRNIFMEYAVFPIALDGLLEP